MVMNNIIFFGPGNIYKPNLAPIALGWSMQALHGPSKAAVAHS